MAQPEEPLYDFPEPIQPTEQKWRGLQRGRDSLRNISVLDRLLLTVPVWLQLSINPATALHILQREPPGAFLVRKSRTSKRNVLCVRLTDDSVPSFVQQFGIREDHLTFCVETSAISFPDLPRLIAFYCVSRDVLPFTLELPEAIAKATSHKQLESISHMGIEFWSSQLNFRGPREVPKIKEVPKIQKEEEKRDPLTASKFVPTKSVATTEESSTSLSVTATYEDPTEQISTIPQTEVATSQSKTNPTLFQEFCPIRTRGPRELNCAPGLAALCFINPLFFQSQNALHRRRLFKRSLKVRVSTETSSLLSPPLAPPPPPPLMPKTKGKRKPKAERQEQPLSQLEVPGPLQSYTRAELEPKDTESQHKMPNVPEMSIHSKSAQDRCQMQGPNKLHDALPTEGRSDQAQIKGQGQFCAGQDEAQAETSGFSDTDYMQPSSSANVSSCTPPFPSTCMTASLLPNPFLTPRSSPSGSPPLSPYQSPSLSKVPFPLSPFTSPIVEDVYHIPISLSNKNKSEENKVEEEVESGEEEQAKDEREEMCSLLQQIYASSLDELGSCSSLSSLEEAAETPPPSPLLQ